jgi:hypothetical protein
MSDKKSKQTFRGSIKDAYIKEQIKRSNRPTLTDIRPIQPDPTKIGAPPTQDKSQPGFTLEEEQPETGVVSVKLERPEEEDSSNIYYNLQLENKDYEKGLPIVAKFDVNRVDEILPRAGEYRVTCARFQLPANIPLFIFPEESRYKYVLELVDKTDPDPANWIFVKDFVKYVDYCEPCFYDRGVYYVNHMLKMVNDLFLQLYNQMKLINPAYQPQYPPRITFEPATELFTLWAESAYVTFADLYQIRMNDVLYSQFFPGFQSKGIFDDFPFDINSPGIQLVVEDQFTNSESKFGLTFYKSITEFSCLPLWNQLEKIFLETDSLPIYAEILGTQADRTKSVLLDFEPPNDVANRQFYSFSPSIYRWVDLKGNEPLTRVDLKIYIEFSGGNSFPLYILVDELASVKLLFTPKSTSYQ